MSTNSSIEWNDTLVDENQAHVIIIITTVMTVLIILSTFTRVVIKLWQGLRLQLEDFLIILGLVGRAMLIAKTHKLMRYRRLT
jgi:cytochrome c oxidase subunit IV